ncbi:prevent-host-death family protein [Methylorubrum populi]|uniref:Antitoxin n=1 Tax=Methylobacterium radiotolerans TaxID=31998 RepID=A0ABU7TGT3_9HYPH
MKTWQAAEAKQNFAKLVEAASSEPQAVMRHSECVGIVLSPEHYRALKAQADAQFARFLLSSPLSEDDFASGLGMSLSSGG